MILDKPRVRRDEFTRRTGWTFEPEGACRGDLCIALQDPAASHEPLPPGPGDWLDAELLARRLRMPLVHDERAGLWCLGPESFGSVLQSAEAPDLRLPTWRDEPFKLSSLRGTRVLLLAWASW